MSNRDMFIGFVLDQSGSMHDLSESTVSGFNEILDVQKAEEGQTLLSLTLFNHLLDVRYIAADLPTVPPMTLHPGPNPYHAGGNTALYDAVGHTIKGMERWLGSHPEFNGQVKVITLTDGLENASWEWHIRHDSPRAGDDWDLLGLIQWKQSEGWEFMYLGAGGSAWLELQKVFAPVSGMDSVHGHVLTDVGHRHAYAVTNSALSASRASGQTLASTYAVDVDNQAKHVVDPKHQHLHEKDQDPWVK